jgi:uncharacterized protein YdcH (DUF465 family)
MILEKHDLHSEFPEFNDEIHHLKINNAHFSRLFKEYHGVNQEVVRIEQGLENTSDTYLEQLKLKRLNLKDNLFIMLKAEKATA